MWSAPADPTGAAGRGMNPFVAVAKNITRLLAFIGRELVEVRRRPGALASLVFGPFLVMAVFGLGYTGYRAPLTTVLVIPPSSGLPTDTQTYQEVAGAGLEIVAVLPDPLAADARLEAGEVDVVAIAPADARQRFETGQQSVIEIRIDVGDPIQEAYAGLMANDFAGAVNREITRQVAEEAQARAAGQGVPDAGRIPPDVIAAPTRAEVANIAPTVPSVVGYFAPAVLALVLQHMAVTLIALSVVRDRTSGTIELFRVSPVSAWEVVTGKILGFGFLCAAISVASFALLVGVLGVPLLGPPALLAGMAALLIAASLGLGLLISIISDSERQAVQLSLLVLLASVFFSGFVLPISEFNDPVRVAAHAIPVTSAIPLIQDVMLRGTVREPWLAGLLAAIAMSLLLACWLPLRRSMSRA
jgi:ABC-2 type transport system permease protein